MPPNCSMLISEVKKPGLEAFPHSSLDLSLCFVGNGPVKTNSPAQQSSTFPWGLSYHSPNKMFYHSPNKGLTVFSSTRNEKKNHKLGVQMSIIMISGLLYILQSVCI